jgi:hypothetical protein
MILKSPKMGIPSRSNDERSVPDDPRKLKPRTWSVIDTKLFNFKKDLVYSINTTPGKPTSAFSPIAATIVRDDEIYIRSIFNQDVSFRERKASPYFLYANVRSVNKGVS